MPELARKKQWRTVACADGSVQTHRSENEACDWVSHHDRGTQFLLEAGIGEWQPVSRVTAWRPGWVQEVRVLAGNGEGQVH